MIAAARAERLPLRDGTVHLVVTSPPYDGIRNYHGRPTVDMTAVGYEVGRVLAPGGVAVVVMQDQTRDGRKSLTTFRTACSWVDDAGLGLWECLVWHRPGVPGGWWNRRFRVDHEYVLVFVKGKRPRHFTKEHMKVPSIGGGTPIHGFTWRTDGGKNRPRPANSGHYRTDGTRAAQPNRVVAPTKCPGTVMAWNPTKCEPRDADRALKREHPATFPQALVSDMVRAFTRPGDVVLDPFAGSGSTPVECRRLGRVGVGIDVSPEYCRLARKREGLAAEARDGSLGL